MPEFIDIDPLYNSTISKLPIESRLSYCISHLDKLQLVLTKNLHLLHPQQKNQLKEMIEAVQTEINELEAINTVSLSKKRNDSVLKQKNKKPAKPNEK